METEKKQKCPICGAMRANLDEHIKKFHSELPTPSSEEASEPDPRYATKEDFNKLADVITGIAKSVNNLVEGQTLEVKPAVTITASGIPGTADLSKVKEDSPTTTTPKPVEENIGEKKSSMPIPPAWRKLVDDVLGPEFGIDVVYPQSGSGFLFKIIVPEEKSNMSKDYKEFYRVDVRTKSLQPNEGEEGIKKFCENVKDNLGRKEKK